MLQLWVSARRMKRNTQEHRIGCSRTFAIFWSMEPMRRTVLLLVLILTAGVAGAEPVAAVTKHVGAFNKERVKYSATVVETMLDGPDGKPAASILDADPAKL